MDGSDAMDLTTQPQTSSLLLLPPELRNEIFAFLLIGPRPISIYLVGSTLYNNIQHFGLKTEILRTCRQCYSEGLAILYGQNVFSVYSVDMRGWNGTGVSTDRAHYGNYEVKTSRYPALPANGPARITTLNITSDWLCDHFSPTGITRVARTSSPAKEPKVDHIKRMLSLFCSLRTLRVYYETKHDCNRYVAELLRLIELVPETVDFELVQSKSTLAAANPDVQVWKAMKARKPESILARKYAKWAENEALAQSESRKPWDDVLKLDPYPMENDDNDGGIWRVKRKGVSRYRRIAHHTS